MLEGRRIQRRQRSAGPRSDRIGPCCRQARNRPPIGRMGASRQAWGGCCLTRFHEARKSPTRGHSRGPVLVSVRPASWAALRGAVSHGRPFGAPQMHLPGRSRAHLPLWRARGTLRPPTHARARGAAARAAIRGSSGRPWPAIGSTRGRPLGCGRALGLCARVLLVSACCRPPATAFEHAVRRRPVLPPLRPLNECLRASLYR